MSETDAEDLLRDTLSQRATEIGADDAMRLLPAAHRRAARRGRVAVAAVVLAVVGVAGGAGVVATGRGGPSLVASQPTAPAWSPSQSNSGWVVRGSRGLEVEVPADWVLNDYACGQTDAASFVYATNGLDCFTAEPPTKQVAVISALLDGDYSGMTERPVVVDGVAATRTEGRLPDGRYGGLLAIPSRATYLAVRTLTAADRDAILDSARLVRVDHLGCAATRPTASAHGDPSAPLIAADPSRIVVCFYGSDAYLIGSAELDATQVATVVSETRAAAPGPNPAPPASMCLPDQSPPDVVLLVDMTPLWVTFSGCGERGVDNGVRWAHVTQAMIAAFMAPLKAAYGFTGDLP
jgi:hypothetical protein